MNNTLVSTWGKHIGGSTLKTPKKHKIKPIKNTFLEKILYLWAMGLSEGRRDIKTTPGVSVVLSYIIAVVMSSASGRESF